VLAADPRANIVVAGDLNDYQFSPALRTLTDGATLTDLITTLPADEQYTYVYNGISQVLDHILVSSPLSSAGGDAVEYQVVHVNSEFSNQASDHDPQVVRIRPVAHQLIGTLTVTPNPVRVRDTVTIRLAGWSPNTALTVDLDGDPIGQVTTDGNGAASLSFTVDKRAAGTHTVTATDPDGGSSSAEFVATKKNCPPTASSEHTCLG
jgi:hypothetical protein